MQHATEAFIDADAVSVSLSLDPNTFLLLLYQTPLDVHLATSLYNCLIRFLSAKNYFVGLLQGVASDCLKLKHVIKSIVFTSQACLNSQTNYLLGRRESVFRHDEHI